MGIAFRVETTHGDDKVLVIVQTETNYPDAVHEARVAARKLHREALEDVIECWGFAPETAESETEDD